MVTKKNIPMGKRLVELRGDCTQVAAAKGFEITQGMLSRYEKGTIPPADILQRISAFYGKSISWILSGEGEMKREPEHATDGSVAILGTINTELRPKEPAIVKIPVYDVHASAGPGAYNHDEAITEFLSVSREFARINFEGKVSGIVCVKVTGNSMEPTLYAGDYCVVATSEAGRITRSGAIYILRNDDALLVKRVHVEGKHYRIVGDNQAEHAFISLKTELETEGYFVVGRVMYCFKAM